MKSRVPSTASYCKMSDTTGIESNVPAVLAFTVATRSRSSAMNIVNIVKIVFNICSK